MDVAISSYIRFKAKNGGYIANRNFQNFFVGETRQYSGNYYPFAPFVISGNISTRSGDSLQANLVTIPNELTVAFISEAISNFWLMEHTVVLLAHNQTNNTFSENQLLSTELWSCAGGHQDDEKITISLNSPLDAARAQIPRRVISAALVGSVPPTGNIFTT